MIKTAMEKAPTNIGPLTLLDREDTAVKHQSKSSFSDMCLCFLSFLRPTESPCAMAHTRNKVFPDLL